MTASEYIAAYDTAAQNENLDEMNRIVEEVCASPDHAFKLEILRRLECDK